jgi:hypothetical protein
MLELGVGLNHRDTEAQRFFCLFFEGCWWSCGDGLLCLQGERDAFERLSWNSGWDEPQRHRGAEAFLFFVRGLRPS